MTPPRRSCRVALVGAAILLPVWLAAGVAFAQVAPPPSLAQPKGTLRPHEPVIRPQPVQTVILVPGYFRTATRGVAKKGASLINMTGDPSYSPPPANSLWTGYLHDTNGKDEYGNGYEARNEFYRAGLYFDVSKLVGHTVARALLRIRVYKTHHRGVHSNPDYSDQWSSCAATVAAGRARWWTSLEPIDVGQPFLRPAPNSTSDMQIDVTPLVRLWLSSPNANFGLVLIGDNEDLGAYTETICQTQYIHSDPGGNGAPTLVIEYY